MEKWVEVRKCPWCGKAMALEIPLYSVDVKIYKHVEEEG